MRHTASRPCSSRCDSANAALATRIPLPFVALIPLPDRLADDEPEPFGHPVDGDASVNDSTMNPSTTFRRVLTLALLTLSGAVLPGAVLPGAVLVLPGAVLMLPSAVLAQTTDGSAETPTDAAAPDEAATAPADTSAAPADTSAAPADTSAAPADTSAAPADTTADGDGAALSDPAADATPSGAVHDEDEETADDAAAADESGEASDSETAEEANARQAAHEPLAWRNSFFSYTVGSTFNSLCRGCQLSYNPTVYSTFYLFPRWYLDAQTFFVIGQGVFVEHTDDDSSTYRNEAQLYDTTIEIRRVESVEGFSFLPAFRLTLPLSKASQAAQRYFNLGVGLTIVRGIPEAAGLTFALLVQYRRWFAGSNVPLTHSPFPATTGSGAPQAPPPLPCGNGGAESCANQATGSTAEADRITAGLTVNLSPFENFTLTLQTFFLWINGFGFRDESIATATSDVVVSDGSNHWRMYSSYSLQGAYDIMPWFNLALGITNATNLEPFFSENGSVRSPFNPDTQFYLSATITLDSLYESFAASGEDDGLTPQQRQRRRQGLARRTTTGGSL